MFLRSRYDILLDKPGTEIIEGPKSDNHLIICGPRGSGRTRALIDDMLSYSHMGNKCLFFSENQERSDQVRRQIPREGPIFFTYNDPRTIRGLYCNGLYLDDFIQDSEDFSRRLDFFDVIMPLFCYGIRIVVVSIVKKVFFDTTGWTFKYLPQPQPSIREFNPWSPA